MTNDQSLWEIAELFSIPKLGERVNPQVQCTNDGDGTTEIHGPPICRYLSPSACPPTVPVLTHTHHHHHHHHHHMYTVERRAFLG